MWLEAVELFVGRGEHRGVAVPDVEASDPAREIDERVSVDIGQRDAQRGVGDDRKGDRQRTRDGSRNPFADLTRTRPGNFRAQVDSSGRDHA